MIISIDTEKTFHKIQHPLMIKKKNPLNNIMKILYDSLTANIILNSESLKSFPLSSKIRKRMLTLTTPTEHNTGSPRQSNQARKRNKKHPNWKGVSIC